MKYIGLYLHVPFCASRCPYCDFYAARAKEDARAAYLSALQRQLSRYAGTADYGFDSIYIGGGTPSVTDGEQLAELLQCMKEEFPVTKDAEITVECNPSSPLETFLPPVVKAGVNRISLGMQSAVDRERRLLGRSADKERVRTCIRLCRSLGVENISLDLMLGIPEQTEQSLEDSLRFCLEEQVPHLSAYLLKLEEGTVFYRRKDALALPSEEEVCRFYLKTAETLKGAGYGHYEISNFALPGYEGKHNLKYWHCEEYLGLGPAAHSFLSGNRFYYPADTNLFLNGTQPVPDGQGGDFKEQFMLRMRLSEGVSENLPECIREKAKQPYLRPYVTVSKSGVSLTEQGFLVSNRVILELLSALDD